VITPRATRLVRVPDLRAMQRAIIALAGDSFDRPAIVIVPTHAAATELRRTFENVQLLERGVGAVFLPELVTRDGFYAHLAVRLPEAPPRLTGFEREVLLRLCARSVEKAGVRPPFRLRPGLIVEILDFYDRLRRSHHTIDDFYRLVTDELSAVADTDRGAERLLTQAEFLAATFAEFEKRAAESGRADEHTLRTLLIERACEPACEHVILAVADQSADPRGLWAADFDLLARMPDLARVDVVATERLLASGFHQRLHELHLPGIEDTRIGADSARPVLRVPLPPDAMLPVVVHTSRDREEELADIARSLKLAGSPPDLERTAVVFQRPLPYLYLARQVFGSAHIPYQATDSLPLAGEPFVAAVDLILTFIGAEATRASTLELLGSPHWNFTDPATEESLTTRDVVQLDALFREDKYLGGWERLQSLAAGHDSPALRAAAATARELAGAVNGRTATEQINTLRSFIVRHERQPSIDDAWHARHTRARAAILSGLAALRDAHARYDDQMVPFAELAAAVRRWIEEQTFTPRTGSIGLLLADAEAARFADVDHVHIVGLIDGDWPQRSPQNIFFPQKLLESLGWPKQSDRASAERAQFQDLIHLGAASTSLWTFSLEDDAIVAPSAFIDEVAAAGLAVERRPAPVRARVFDHEALALEPVDPAGASHDAGEWLRLRTRLPATDDARYHGAAGARNPTAYAVSRLERYIECPFKYFAAYVLRLDEERDEQSGLTPQERGQLLHSLFESFFREWNASGRGALTPDLLEDALARFEQIADVHLQRLREGDRALERTYLLGSAVAPGLAERAFAFEIEHGVGVVERLLEHALEGSFVFQGSDGPREVSLKAKADRIDLLEDGTLRIIDYKIGRAPKTTRALQLPVYGLCAQQQLDGRDGRAWTVSRAGYVAFKEKNPFVSIGNNLEKALADGEQRLLTAVASIENGSFPVRPHEPWLCTRCGFALVCRKDYVGDD
jgi:RecB family exonuclease